MQFKHNRLVVDPVKKLYLLYLANDILQTSKRKGGVWPLCLRAANASPDVYSPNVCTEDEFEHAFGKSIVDDFVYVYFDQL
jgi:hypothetical protein